jgi:hypothetical protein
MSTEDPIEVGHHGEDHVLGPRPAHDLDTDG